MAQRTLSFQNPLTGVSCVVGYFFDTLFVKPCTSGTQWSRAPKKDREQTKKWCAQHNEQKFATAKAASEYVATHFGPNSQDIANAIRHGN